MIHSEIILLFKVFLAILHFVFDRKLRIAVSSSVPNCVGILMGNALNLKRIFVRWPFSPC